jgi:hypothetical protein
MLHMWAFAHAHFAGNVVVEDKVWEFAWLFYRVIYVVDSIEMLLP